MKNWERYEKEIKKVLGACQRRYRWGYVDQEIFHDAAMFGICEAWGLPELGMTEEQIFHAAASAAVRFMGTEVRRGRKAVPMYMYGPNGSEYATLDYMTKGARPTQEEDVDARAIRRAIGDDEMAEMISYGDRGEGGIPRMRAERAVRQLFGTYVPLSARRRSTA